ncbi:aminotransferase class III-fold pyridoxal phosphate-dependent enzyme [Vibrio sp. PP-XX7]
MVGVRIARSVTKRPKVVIFHGAFHGSFDAVLASGWLEDGQPQTVPLTDGTPQSIVDDTMVLTYGDARSLDVIRQYADEIAAVVIEPVQSRNPALQPVQFVRDLRQITQAHEIALICDDIILDSAMHWMEAEAG